MLSAEKKKYVKALQRKKFRDLNQCFVVEGVKMVSELLNSDFKVHDIYATKSWFKKNSSFYAQEISEKELKSISSLKTPNEVLAVVQYQQINDKINSNFSIVLDKIQDPGNIGTIIRTADWFGVEQIICSKDTVDCYNSKVIQATMGSLFRVKIIYCDLKKFLSTHKKSKVYGALLNGENVFQKKLQVNDALLIMGNESKGISEDLLPFITDKISIPKFGKAESLNVATATAILCAAFKN